MFRKIKINFALAGLNFISFCIYPDFAFETESCNVLTTNFSITYFAAHYYNPLLNFI